MLEVFDSWPTIGSRCRLAFFLLGLASLPFPFLAWAAPPLPEVSIDQPEDGWVTNEGSVDVTVSFHSDRRGGIRRVELFLDDIRIGSHAHPPSERTGSYDFEVDLADRPDGPAVLTGVVWVGNPAAGLFADASILVHIDRTAPLLALDAPRDGFLTREATTRVVGATSEPASLSIAGVSYGLVDGAFDLEVPLREGSHLLAVAAADGAGNTSLRTVWVSRDTVPPKLTILHPAPGATLQSSTVAVSGLVQDLGLGAVGEGQVSVWVNGIEAEVKAGGFLAEAVPVAEGHGSLVALARDSVGNSTSASVPVVGDPRPKARLVLDSGDGQTGIVGGLLAEPLVVRAEDSSGVPVPGIPIAFRIARGDGSFGNGARREVVPTDSEGRASVLLTLGSRVGAASDRVEASPDGEDQGRFFGRPAWAATAVVDPASPRQLAAVDGALQVTAVGAQAPRPLVARLTDDRGNPIADQAVIFEVLSGGGHLGGLPVADVQTDFDGRAAIGFVAGTESGINAHHVAASHADAAPVHFAITALEPGPVAETTLSGIVLTNDNLPIPGVTLHQGSAEAVTDSEGRFVLEGVEPGPVHVGVDGHTAGPFPHLEYELTMVSGAANSFDRPIYLPVIDDDGIAWASGTRPAMITRHDTPGFQMTLPTGAATFVDGSKEGQVQVTRVNRDKVPMAPPNGSLPRMAFSIQPPTVHFDPPAPIRFPNTEGGRPGEIITIFSFDHDVGSFVAVGTAQVSEDGAFIVSEKGQGIVKGGWHLVLPGPGEGTCIRPQCCFLFCSAENECEARKICNNSNSNQCGTTIAPAEGTPDSQCWSSCPLGDGIVCARNNHCGFDPNPSNLSIGSDCTRGFDPIYGLTGELGSCLRDAESGLPICCPKDHWDVDGNCYTTPVGRGGASGSSEILKSQESLP